jgi:putative colanic acid biosysnthesis UDP-glucose lipid carrier transferase
MVLKRKKQNEGMIRPYQSRFSFLLRQVDGVLIFFTLLISLHVMERGSLNKLYLLAAMITIFVFYFFAPLLNLYRSWRDTSFWSGLNTLIKVWILTVFTVVCLGFITKTSAQYSRMAIGFWFILAPFALGLWRFVLLSALYKIRKNGRNSRTAVIAGADDIQTATVRNEWRENHRLEIPHDDGLRGWNG